MPSSLKRYQDKRDLHFITFSCYHRQPFLSAPQSCDLFERCLERCRIRYGFFVTAYVVMPEHVHLLISEPENGTLASAIQAIKQSVSRKLIGDREHFWQERYYDFNVYTAKKRIEKLCYIHRNPVKRGLVEHPEQWKWSSFLHHATGDMGRVEIESQWTARRREKMGFHPQVKIVARDTPRETKAPP
jgi:putative transposase